MSMQMIPLNQLVASSANVRKTGAKADIEALAASIAAHGLLQNLSVQPRSENKFEVVAGSRRHAALKLLAKAGTIARDYPVPCNLVEADGASEASLAENVQRVAMNAMDEADAFKALAEQGLDAGAIARRFGATTRHVEQRLALAELSPKVKAAYRRDDITLDAARAFCIEPDHAKQDAVLRALGKPIGSGGQVRSLLMQGAMKANDRLVRFVGVEAYETAGGAISRDLFDHDTVFIADPGLIARLADERLEAVRRDLIAQGWSWVEINTGAGQLSGLSGQRIQPTRRPMTRAERAALAKIDAEIEAFDAQLNDSDNDDDAAWRTREERDADRQALIEKTQTWDPELMALAGVVATINHEGALSLSYGLVAKADQTKLKRLLAARAPEGAAQSEDAPSSEVMIAGPRLPKAVARDLTGARASALRMAVANAPAVALAVMTFACISSALHQRRSLAVGISADPVALGDLPAFEQKRDDVLARLPEDGDVLSWCLGQDQEALSGILAVVVAETLDLVHEGASANDADRQKFADRLAAALDLDMREHWSVDRAFLARLSKPMLMDILTNAPAIAAKPAKRRDALLKTHAKQKRDDLAKTVAKTLDGAGWLPEILVTPIGAGALAVTAEGEAETQAIAAE